MSRDAKGQRHREARKLVDVHRRLWQSRPGMRILTGNEDELAAAHELLERGTVADLINVLSWVIEESELSHRAMTVRDTVDSWSRLYAAYTARHGGKPAGPRKTPPREARERADEDHLHEGHLRLIASAFAMSKAADAFDRDGQQVARDVAALACAALDIARNSIRESGVIRSSNPASAAAALVERLVERLMPA